jgi:N-acetylmuramoyl-L-alanine amidase
MYQVIKLPRIKYTSSDITLLARIMRAEALGEGSTGMLLVGNVVVNRAKAQCPPFKKTNTIYSVVYKKGQFEGVGTKLFNQYPTSHEKKLAKDCLEYYQKWPAKEALFFKNPGKGKPCPSTFYGKLIGRYKNHCFFTPEIGMKNCKF